MLSRAAAHHVLAAVPGPPRHKASLSGPGRHRPRPAHRPHRYGHLPPPLFACLSRRVWGVGSLNSVDRNLRKNNNKNTVHLHIQIETDKKVSKTNTITGLTFRLRICGAGGVALHGGPPLPGVTRN